MRNVSTHVPHDLGAPVENRELRILTKTIEERRDGGVGHNPARVGLLEQDRQGEVSLSHRRCMRQRFRQELAKVGIHHMLTQLHRG